MPNTATLDLDISLFRSIFPVILDNLAFTANHMSSLPTAQHIAYKNICTFIFLINRSLRPQHAIHLHLSTNILSNPKDISQLLFYSLFNVESFDKHSLMPTTGLLPLEIA